MLKNKKKKDVPAKRVETSASVRIDRELNNQLDEWLKTDTARGLGFHSKSDFLNEAVRDTIQRVRGPRFADLMLNIDNDYTLIDLRLNPPNDFVVVLVDPKHKSLRCTFCKSEVCDHIMYIWKSPSQRLRLHQDRFECKIKFGKFHYDV